ncbi:hypothetical protein EYF80_058486 [Liparis tanakae]|uniref:Uncharacterized protein n=1 Tax=Liparis tanakae TaxID=230148 RepID=A0A4Z2ESV7_9TELE|nr:hypothetical protein EYF80_058486 [Liparis tanakae]
METRGDDRDSPCRPRSGGGSFSARISMPRPPHEPSEKLSVEKGRDFDKILSTWLHCPQVANVINKRIVGCDYHRCVAGVLIRVQEGERRALKTGFKAGRDADGGSNVLKAVGRTHLHRLRPARRNTGTYGFLHGSLQGFVVLRRTITY